jgi:hypothetical protein
MNIQTSRGVAGFTVMALTIGLGYSGRPSASGQGPENSGKAKAGEFVVESYYKAKWGQADEFLRLYKKTTCRF